MALKCFSQNQIPSVVGAAQTWYFSQSTQSIDSYKDVMEILAKSTNELFF